MDVTLALQRAVRGFPHGTEALAARLGMRVSSLLHKVSPTYPSAHCSPEEMLEIMDATGDNGALIAMAARRSCLLLPMPRGLADDSSGALALAASVREFGQFVAEAAQDISDGKVTGNELARMEREGAEALAAIHELLRLAHTLHDAARPAGEPPLRSVA